jgi:phosphoribosylformylglycinamidine synthase
MRPRALILYAPGTNRDQEAAAALMLAGADAEVMPLRVLRERRLRWAAYQMLVIPGGFSYADALGAGRLLALDLTAYFGDEARAFVNSGRPVIGICNGFQALVKAGLLQPPGEEAAPSITLTHNASGRFECRWVRLQAPSSACVWTRDLDRPLECPVAHGEGRLVASAPEVIERLCSAGQVALVYAGPSGEPAAGAYPHNPNGSAADIAGLCNSAGNVLGLMPHPEDHVYAHQHPRWARGERSGNCQPLFEAGVRHAAAC